MQSTNQRFWSKVSIVNLLSCWQWTGAISSCGYGHITVDKVDHLAHRFAWIVTKGAIPSGSFVLHRCDNKRCVNPGHLFLGTHKDNMKDMVNKGRAARGDIHGNSKLSLDQVLAIRRLFGTIPVTEIARRFDVAFKTVYRIAHRESWKHIP